MSRIWHTRPISASSKTRAMVKCHRRARRRKADAQGNRCAGRMGQGIRRKGPCRHESDRDRRRHRHRQIHRADRAKAHRDASAQRMAICSAFAADKPKIVHKVLGELRLKMAHDLKLSPRPNSPGSGSSISRCSNGTRKRISDSSARIIRSPSPLDEDHAQARQPRPTSSSNRSRAKPTTSSSTAAKSAAARIRIHRMDVQQKVFSLLGIDDASAKAKVRLPARRPAIWRIRRTAASPWAWIAWS